MLGQYSGLLYTCTPGVPSHAYSGLGHVQMSLDQWSVSKSNATESLVSPCTLGSVFLESICHAVKKYKQPCGEAHLEENGGLKPTPNWAPSLQPVLISIHEFSHEVQRGSQGASHVAPGKSGVATHSSTLA